MVKTLAVVGFLATLLLIVFLVISGVKHIPGAFSSLSEMMNTINGYKNGDDLIITTDKTVVNSGESFQITWTDIPLIGEYGFKYSCDGGVFLEVRSADGELVPMKCTDTLTLSNDATGLFLYPLSKEMRFSDVELTVIFSDTDKKVALENSIKVTVVNATIPFRDTDVEVVKEDTKETEAPVRRDSVKPVAPKVASPYPASNPNGYTDLVMTILGNGVLRNGVFIPTTSYDNNENNALRFDVKNIGTKRSEVWSFSVVLPDGEVYTSKTQIALNPQEHIEFTLGFFIDKEDGVTATLTPTLHTTGDASVSNNSKTIAVPVK